MGSFATAEIGVQGLEIVGFTSSTGFDIPAITPSNGLPFGTYIATLPVATSGLAGQLSTLQHGDITISLNGAGVASNNLCIQSFDLSLNLNRQPNQCMGSKYPDTYELQFPINAQLTVQANMKDLATGRLSTSNCQSQKFTVQIDCRAATCNGSAGAIKARYTLGGATLDSQSYSVDTNGIQQTIRLLS